MRGFSFVPLWQFACTVCKQIIPDGQIVVHRKVFYCRTCWTARKKGDKAT